MKFLLVDSIVERTDDRIVTLKQVTLAEEYLADHFPAFPVLPGVMMLEAMVQSARQLLQEKHHGRLVLASVRAMKFGNMVRPGEALEIEVTVSGPDEHGSWSCRGVGRVRGLGEESFAQEAPAAVSGRFVMRPVQIA